MKTLEEFIKEIESSEELKEELKNASDEMLESFLKKHDCKSTAKEFVDFAKAQAEGEIGDDDAGAVAGGLPLLC